MARVSFPKFGEVEGNPVFVMAALVLIVVAALAGLSIWKGGGSSNETPPYVGPSTTLDQFDDFDDLDGPYDYGDDPYLDSLYDACDAGSMFDCDSLYLDSPVGSEYEWFGATCGNTYEWLGGGC